MTSIEEESWRLSNRHAQHPMNRIRVCMYVNIHPGCLDQREPRYNPYIYPIKLELPESMRRRSTPMKFSTRFRSRSNPLLIMVALDREPAARYPSSFSSSNGVIGPGLPIGASRGLTGFGIARVRSVGGVVVDAARACAIMSLWYCCSFLLTSLLFLSCAGLFFLAGLLKVGICRLVVVGVKLVRGVDDWEEIGDI